jgi:hypothetical protein
VLLLALVGVAGLVRFPYLWSIPQFTDEVLDNLVSLAIARGERFPLQQPPNDYVGALHLYIGAAGFWLFGVATTTPRLVVWLLGAAAVAATYVLARTMLRRPSVWVAAGLLATSGVHIGANSHLAWAHATTPLYFAVACAFLTRAVQRVHGPSLVAAALAGAATLQTHPTVVAFLPACTAYLVWRAPALLRTKWLWYSVVAGLLGYGNMLVYNLISGLGSLRNAQFANAGFDAYPIRTIADYLEYLGPVLLALVRVASGAVDARPTPLAYLADPQVVSYTGLTGLGTVLLWRRGNPLPAMLIASAAVLFPLFAQEHDVLPRRGRYLAPLLPIICVAVADAWDWLCQHIGPLLAGHGVRPLYRRGALLGATMLLIVLPLLPLWRYYEQSLADGQTNTRFFALLAQIEQARLPNEPVVLDAALNREDLGGGGTALRAIDYLLTVRGIPHVTAPLEPTALTRRAQALGTGPSALLILGRRAAPAAIDRLPLEPPAEVVAGPPRDPYGIRRVRLPQARQ